MTDQPLGVWLGPDVDEEQIGDLVVEALTGESPLPRPHPDEMAELVAEDISRKKPEEISAALVGWAEWYSDGHPEDTWKPSSSS
jgi:hypothetical protein